VLLRSGGITSILPEVGRLLGFATLMLALAFMLLRRRT
jgi:hypothetical protein